MDDCYPKVLFVTPCAFNNITGGGVTFSNLFMGWPKEKLATVSGDVVPVSHDICNKYFFLSPRELNYVRPFSCLLSKKRPGIPNKRSFTQKHFVRRSSSIKCFGRKIVGEAGVPDCGTLSDELKAWIGSFRPDLLYTILGSPGYIDIVLQIQSAFHLPLVIHLMDDGVTDPRKKGLFGRYLRQLHRKKFYSVLGKTRLAMAICEAMASEYSKRYGVPFIHFQNPVDLQKWEKFAKQDVAISGKPKIVFAGSILTYAQLQSLIDCCHAVKTLNEQGMSMHLDIFTPRQLFSGNFSMFEISREIRVHDIPENDESFFSLLGQADVLLLPVNFDARSVHFVRFSMPTKVPSYLASGTPILVYGPSGVAQVEYAREYGWGAVVDRRDIDALVRSLWRILKDLDLRRQLSQRARQVAKEYHDSQKVKVSFQKMLCEAAEEGTC